MTKADIQLLAQAFHANKREFPGLLSPTASKQTRGAWNREAGSHTQWYSDVQTIADAIARHHPRFDREAFVTACKDGTDD